MTTNLSTNEITNIIIGSVIGGVALLAALGAYRYKHSNDPKDDDNKPITVTHHDNASGLSRRKKSHIKSKKSRKRNKK